ncbi:MAG: hypothetical protein ACR2OV_11465 [Hyphomicrobiaceae bacterium]
MNWSNMILKSTLGSGSLAQIAVLSIALKQHIGLWIIALVLVPLTILLMTKVSDAIPLRVVKIAHAVAVAWYVALASATVAISATAMSIFTPAFALIATLLALGLVPCVAIARALWRGDYEAPVTTRAEQKRSAEFDLGSEIGSSIGTVG